MPSQSTPSSGSVTRICDGCGAQFFTFPSRVNPRYCSLPCAAAGMRGNHSRICEWCGTPFVLRRPSDRQRFHAASCRIAASIRPAPERFREKVRVTGSSECWIWRGGASGGYGNFFDGKRSVRAHRYSYELAHGPVRPAFDLDHLCRNTLCVNPAHLEVVTHRENVLRGVSPFAQKSRKSACARGHAFDEANTMTKRVGSAVHRTCRTCNRLNAREWREKRREAKRA